MNEWRLGVEDFIGLAAGAANPLPVVAACLSVLYLLALWRLRQIGRRWSLGRAAAFLTGLAITAALTGLAIDSTGTRLFSVFMFQQLTLVTVVPALLILGAPLRLARLIIRLRPDRLRALRRVARVILHPVVGTIGWQASFYGLYFTGVGDWILQRPPGHVWLEVAFVILGLVALSPVIGGGPAVRLALPLRALDVAVEMALHAFFGVIVMSSVVPLVPSFASTTAILGLDPIGDQQIAGALAWSYGELPSAVLLVGILHRWFTVDQRRARHRDRRIDRDGDAELEAYNRSLAALEDRGTSHPHGER